jgi:beta-galactosidase beta subunit
MANEKLAIQDVEKIQRYMEEFRVNMEILESAVKDIEEGNIHIPNLYATLSTFDYQLKELKNTTAHRLYQEWNSGKY